MARRKTKAKDDWDSASLTQPAMEILTNPRKWRIVSSAFETEIAPVLNEQHLEWMRDNSHSVGHQEIKIVLRGQGFHGFRGKVYPYSPGTIFLFDYQEKRDYRCPVFASDADMLWVQIVNDLLIFTQIKIRDGDFKHLRWSRLTKEHSLGFVDWKDLVSFVRQPNVDEELRRLRTYLALSGALTAILDNGFIDETRGNRESFQRSVVDVVLAHIVEFGGVGISLDDLARVSGYSKYHLSRLFKQYTGKTIHDHINHVRMALAEDMLSQGISKKQVSGSLGFSCPASFSRWMRQYGNE